MGILLIGFLVVIAVVVLGGGLYVMGAYNGLVTLRNRFKNAFAQIDVQLKRRYDLIPNLVETAKGYMKHEAGTLEAVIQARNSAASAGALAAANPGDPAAMKISPSRTTASQTRIATSQGGWVGWPVRMSKRPW